MRDSVWIDMAQLVRDRSLARRACSSRGAEQEGGAGGLDAAQPTTSWSSYSSHHEGPRGSVRADLETRSPVDPVYGRFFSVRTGRL